MSWADHLLDKARAIHSEIAALQLYLAEPHDPPLTPEQAEGLFAAHYALLDDLYLRQLPFAKAASGSDLFLNYRGAFDPRERASLSAVDRLFGNVRAQIGSVTRAVAEARQGEVKSGKEEAELTVSAYGPGLYVGFTLPRDADAASPSAAALAEGLRCLGAVARALPEAGAKGRIAAVVDDPQVRDAALGALKKLLPVRDSSVEAVELRGLALDLREPAAIDRAAWKTADDLMVQPVASLERGTFTGHLLSIDYELHRFDLRWLDDPKVGNIRCAYGPKLAEACEGLARKKVEVQGAVDFRGGRPRLVHVESIREI